MGLPTVRVGVDIGGTFTDVALQGPDGLVTGKVLTDYAQPERAILAATLAAARQAGIAPGDIGQVIHGTTLVTNALIERRGARMAFITTEGFRDVIEMRSENRFEQYDLNLSLPLPMVPRKDRFTLNERMGPKGEVLLPLDPAEARAMAERIVAAGYEAVAIGLMHAYANDAHERMMAAALADLAPDLSVSISCVISPQLRELPRFNTVIANAYVQPRVSAYLGRLVESLRAAGIDAPVFLMHSGGGLISVDTAAEQPVRLLESGPAGGAIFAARYARAHGIDRVLSFDMGGTRPNLPVEEPPPRTPTASRCAAQPTVKKGLGMTVRTPVVEIGGDRGGGGSIASVDTYGPHPGRPALGRVEVRGRPGYPARRGGAHRDRAILFLAGLDPRRLVCGRGHCALGGAVATTAMERAGCRRGSRASPCKRHGPPFG